MTRLFTLIAVLCCSTVIGAEHTSPYITRGITADGRVVTAAPHAPRPWAADVVKLVQGPYPAAEFAKHHEGDALVRVLLDVKTGAVREVQIEKSSGYPELDAIAMKALRQWKLRPGRWREFEVYVGMHPRGSKP